MSESSHVGDAHGTAEAGNPVKKLPGKNDKMKYYIIGGLALVALLVFFFVHKSSSATSAAPTGSTVAGYGATGTNSLLSSLLSSGMLNNSGGSNPYSNGITGPRGATGPAGAAGAAGGAGPAGPSGTNSTVPVKTTTKVPTPIKPGGPIKSPANQTITVQKGQTLLSLSEKYFGTSNRTALAHMNGLGTGAGLKTGQKLKV